MIVLNKNVIAIDETYEMFVPINMKVTDLINFIKDKALEQTGGVLQPKSELKLYDVTTTNVINANNIVKYSGIKFGSKLLLK